MRPKPFAFIILDGWGYEPGSAGNAVEAAKTPNLDSYFRQYASTFLKCSGLAVGLPEGQMGNSEVGHLNIGAGRVVFQDLTRISISIDDASFFANPVLDHAMKTAAQGGGVLHLMGLVSDGGVHSSDDHYFALIKMAAENAVKDLAFHAFLDGRDVPPQSAIAYLEAVEDQLRTYGYKPIATVSGRYYAMDRDNRWERVRKAYDALVHRHGFSAHNALDAVTQAYKRGEVDEFVQPTITEASTRGIITKDSVIFFNFRADRTRELTRTLIEPKFEDFDRGDDPPMPTFTSMTEYDKKFAVNVAFPPIDIAETFADVIAENGLMQLHIAETEKYAHVTFFFNGGVEEPKTGEERILIPSPSVATYDLKPEMSAVEVADATIAQIHEERFDVIILNFANCDMVGHTGDFAAAVKAVETVDTCVGKVIQALTEKGGECLILADHGNAEQMIEAASGRPHTAHTSNLVPMIYVSREKSILADGGALCDVAPTALHILKLPQPELMTGVSLVRSP